VPGGGARGRREIAGRDGRVGLDLFLDEFESSFAPPAEFAAWLAEAGLGDAVGEGDQPVAGDGVEFGHLDAAVRPVLGDHALPLDLKILVAAQVDERRIVHLDRPGFSAGLEVEHGEGRVADFADFTHRQRVHDDFGRLEHVHVRADEFERHCGGHRSEQIGFDAAAEAVGEDGEMPALRLQPLEEEVVSADVLPVVDQLAAFHFDKHIVRHGRLTS